MRLSFCWYLNDYYHEFHGIGNSFHDHVHAFGTISHSLQGMVQIQLDWNGDFLLKAHYLLSNKKI